MVVGLALSILLLGTGCASGVSSPDDGESSVASASSTTPVPQSAAHLLVNLGDSFAAGVGVRPLVADSPVLCQRSSANAGHVLAARHGYRLVDVTCGGADTDDFFAAQYEGVPPQLDAITGDADLVTMMIGGNNGRLFSRAIADCRAAMPSDPAGAPCRARYGTEFIDLIARDTAPELRRVFTEVRRRAPHAQTLVVGYPWLLPRATGCADAMPIAVGDVPYLRQVQATLNRAVATAAAATGVRFVDMSGLSAGHDACAAPGRRWTEPIVGADGAAPAHPNAEGQRAIADAIDAAR